MLLFGDPVQRSPDHTLWGWRGLSEKKATKLLSNNSQRARSLMANERVTLIMVGFFTTEATSSFECKKTHVFAATIPAGKTTTPGREGKKIGPS